jgi:uncharacterized protein (DUF1015 family)
VSSPEHWTGARVGAFRAITYDQAVAGPLGDLVAPPYDVVSPGDRERLAARSPWNVVRVDLPDVPYDQVRAVIAAWLADGVIRQHEAPVMLAWTQRFTLGDGSVHERRTLLATVALEPYAARVVRPHERTHAGPKEDRLRLMRATGVQLSPIYGLYPDPEGTAWAAAGVSGPPLGEVTDDEGTLHRVWVIEDAAACAAVSAALAGRWILIADGHHRYETALAYRDERRAEGGDGPWDHVMMGLTAIEDPGLVVLPTHRVLGEWPEGAEARMDVRPVDGGVDALLDALHAEPAGVPAFGLVLPGRAAVLVGRPSDDPSPAGRLDLSVLERDLLVPALGGDQAALARRGVLTYTKDATDAWDRVRSGAAAAALIVRPLSTTQVAEVAEAGEVMPQKSTYFFPKLLTGVAFQPLD